MVVEELYDAIERCKNDSLFLEELGQDQGSVSTSGSNSSKDNSKTPSKLSSSLSSSPSSSSSSLGDSTFLTLQNTSAAYQVPPLSSLLLSSLLLSPSVHIYPHLVLT